MTDVLTPPAPTGSNDERPGPPPPRPKGRAAKPTAKRAKPRAARKAAATPARKGPDFRPTVRKLLKTVAAGLTLLGRRSRPFLLDAFVLSESADDLADAVHEFAADQPYVAAILERVGRIAPATGLATALVPVLAQIAANHELVPPDVLATLDVRPPADIMAQLDTEARQLAERLRAGGPIGGADDGGPLADDRPYGYPAA